MQPGPRNLITDVAGLKVGSSEDKAIRSGVSVLTADAPFVAAVHVMGGAPGTRETDLLAPHNLVQEVDALVLSGGSALGLDAASGVANALRRQGRGFVAQNQNVPIVPAAILFDLANGGDKGWADNPYADLGEMALLGAGEDFDIGTAGAGAGCLTATLKGGLGSASAILPDGTTVGALVAVNAVGSVTCANGPHFWAAPFEVGAEFGGKGPDPTPKPEAMTLKSLEKGTATTIAVVATDAALTQAQAQRMAVAAHDGLARAILPAHTPFDGDLVFAVSTATRELTDPMTQPLLIGHAAAICLSRAVARGVYAARAEPGDLLPSYAERFGA